MSYQKRIVRTPHTNPSFGMVTIKTRLKTCFSDTQPSNFPAGPLHANNLRTCIPWKYVSLHAQIWAHIFYNHPLSLYIRWKHSVYQQARQISTLFCSFIRGLKENNSIWWTAPQVASQDITSYGKCSWHEVIEQSIASTMTCIDNSKSCMVIFIEK